MTSVLPLAGRLAEAARLVLLTEADSRALAGLAAVPDDELEAGLMSDQATAVAERTRAAIGDYGLRFGRAPAAGGLRSLLAWLEEASGIGPLESALGEGAFGSRPEQRARSVLRELEQLALRSSSSITLRRAIHAVAAEPALLPMRAFEAREALHRAAPHHPMVEVLTRLLTERDPARRLGLGPAATDEETRQEALRLATSARRSAALTDATSEQDAAEAVAAWCRLELQRLETRAQPDGIRVRP